MNHSEPRRVVITGVSGGIGRAMTRRLIDNGYRVAGLDLEADNIQSLVDDVPDRLQFWRWDVTSGDDVRSTVDEILEWWGGVDILVNNAAISGFAPFEKLTIEEFRDLLEVNYLGYVRMIRAVLPLMRQRGEGIIHNVGSATGLVGHPGLAPYASSKGAVEALTQSLRHELRGEDVHATVMHPPMTATENAKELGLGYPDFAAGDPEDVGAGLADRIESTSSWVTPDWSTSVSLVLIRWFPSVFRRFLDRYVKVH